MVSPLDWKVDERHSVLMVDSAEEIAAELRHQLQCYFAQDVGTRARWPQVVMNCRQQCYAGLNSAQQLALSVATVRKEVVVVIEGA